MEPPAEEFERLRKLLALKRHEKPPPGYFEGFSSEVMSRIEAAEKPPGRNWWLSLVAAFNARPLLLGAYGAAAVAVVLVAVNLTRHPGASEPAGASVPNRSVAQQPPSNPSNDLGTPSNTGAVMVLSSTSAPPDFLVHPGSQQVERVSFPKRN